MRYTLEEMNRTHEFDLREDGDLQFAKGLLLTGSRFGAVEWIRNELGAHHPAVQTHAKAASPALTTTGDQLALSAQVTAYERRLRQREILAQIPGTMPALVGTRTPFLTDPTTATWGIPFPAVSVTVTDEVSAATSYGLLLPVSREWLKISGEPGVRVLGLLLTLALSRAGDAFLLDAEAASDTRPAGLLNGVDLTVTGGSPEMIDEGILTLNAEVRNGDAIAPAFISSRSGALYLSSLDRPMFKDTHAEGASTIAGIRHITSSAAGNKLIYLDGASIVVADNGLHLDASSQASVVLDTVPTSPANVVSAFQTNVSILRAVRTIHWQRAHDDAVAYLELPLLEGGSPGL